MTDSLKPEPARDQFGKQSLTNLSFFDRYYTAMQALAKTMQKTDRLLTGDLKLKVIPTTTRQNGMDVPGFSTNNEIHFNYDKFKNIGSASTLVALMGLNYHELAHLMFTVKNGRELRDFLLGGAASLFRYWNMLEDQRIESLFWATSPPSGKYFTQMVVDFMVENEDSWPLGHALVYGRRFVPKNIRDGFKSRWAGTVLERQEVERLIDEFKSINFADMDYDFRASVVQDRRAQRAKAIIVRYAEILQAVALRENSFTPDGSCLENQSVSNRDKAHNGDPREESNSETERAVRQMKDQEKQQEEVEEEGDDGSGFWDDVESEDGDEEPELPGDDSGVSDDEMEYPGEGTDDAGDEGESASEGGSSGEDLEDSDQEAADGEDGEDDVDASSGTPGGSGDDAGDHEDGDDDDADSSVDGAGSDPNAGDSDYDFKQDLKDVIDALDRSTSVNDDVQQLRDAINNPFSLDVESDYIESEEEVVTEEMAAIVRDVEREFSRLYSELEPGWLYGSNTGKLNAERWFRNSDFEEAFDEWDEGHEQNSGMEMVILLDTSFSMNGIKITQASQSVWVVKRATDMIEATVSGLTFDSDEKTLYRRADKANMGTYLRPKKLGGSTIPNQALHTARRIFSESALPNKLLVVVTDGAWSDQHERQRMERTENSKKLLEAIDATKLLFLIGVDSHLTADYFDIAQRVKTPTDIAPLVAQAINHILNNARR